MVNITWRRQCSPCHGPGEVQPLHFEQCQWQKTEKPHIAYVAYRWFFAIQFLIILLWSFLNTSRYGSYYNYGVWFAFFTNWSYTLCVVQSFFGLFIVQMRWMKRNNYKGSQVNIPKHYKLYGILHTTAVDIAIGITFVYWTFVFDPTMHNVDALNILSHIFNSIFMVTDLWLIAYPCRVVHFIYPVTVGFCYAVFSYIYYLCGGRDSHGRIFIYSAMNWEKPGKAAAFSIGILVIAGIIHFIVYGLSRLRCWLARPRFLSKTQPPASLMSLEKPSLLNIA